MNVKKSYRYYAPMPMPIPAAPIYYAPAYGASPVQMLNVADDMPDPVEPNHYYDDYKYNYAPF